MFSEMPVGQPAVNVSVPHLVLAERRCPATGGANMPLPAVATVGRSVG